MSERSEFLGTASSPAVPPVDEETISPAATQPLAEAATALPPASHTGEEEAKARIASLDREAKALGADPRSALLFHEMGLLWEGPLKNPRNAAVAFQNAYKIAPKFLTNIRAARRLFADVGNWQMVIQLLDAELSGEEEPRQRASLLFEKGSILEERLSREEDAVSAFRQCLELKPTDVTLLTQLEMLYSTKGDFASLVTVYRLLAATLSEPSLRAHYLTTAGLLLEDRLKSRDAAAEILREAFKLDRKELILLTSMKRVAEREGRSDELLSALAAEAELLGEEATPVYLQIAKVYERLDRKEDALAALLAARRVSPTEPLVLSELAGIYEAQGRFEDLADILLSWASSIQDESELVALNLRLASLYEEDLKRDEGAIGRYHAILERVPGHAAALGGLGKLNYRTQNWEGLVSTFDLEIAAAEDPSLKAAKMYKAAEVLEERLGRHEEAIQRYNSCLQLLPGYLPAQKALTRMYERQGRFAELVAMHEQDLLQTSDRDQLILTLNKMAMLYEERLSDNDRAIECMKRILEMSADHLPSISNLSRLYDRTGRYRELIQNHELEASLAGDTKQVLSLHHRNAEILDEQLKDRAGAIAAYERVLALSPSYLPALRALGRLYAQDGRWEQLIRMYRAEAEIARSTEQAAGLIFKIGELYEQRLKNENEAIASYQEVLTLAPNYFPALRALARIYRVQRDWESLIEVLRAEGANRTDPLERANALYQVATIWEDSLTRLDMAIEGYQEVLRLVPGHAPTLRALERLYLAQDNLKELVVVLDRETQVAHTSAAKVGAYLKLARLYLDRFLEPSRAAQCCEAALALEPHNVFALKTLERIRVGDRSRRSELRSRLSGLVTDSRMSTALRLAVAADEDKAHPTENALAVLKDAFEEDPSNPRITFMLERALRQAADWTALHRLYLRRLEKAEDADERLSLLMRSAELAEVRLGDFEQAAKAYQSALMLQPQFLAALQGLRRVMVKLKDLAAARKAYEMEAVHSHDARGAIEAYVAAARIAFADMQDDLGARALYRKALERDPLDPQASAGLESLLAQEEDAAELASLFEHRAEARLTQRDAPGAATAFFAAAKLAHGVLGDSPRALSLADRALSAQPAHAAAMELRGSLLQQSGQYAEAAAVLSTRVQQGGEPEALAQLHLKLGSIYQDQLSDLSRAAAHLQTVLATQPQHAEALQRLAELHMDSRNWTGAMDCLKRLLELPLAPEVRARHLVSLARVHEEGLQDAAGAASLYRQALELAPQDASLVDRLVVLYERTHKVPELIQMLEAQAVGTSDLNRALSLRLRVAELYSQTLNQPAKAVGTYKHILELDPENVPARVALAQLYVRDPGSAPLAIEEHRRLLKQNPTRVESLHALFALWEGAQQQDRAFCVAAILHSLKSADEAESAFYLEARNRLPSDPKGPLAPADLDFVIMPKEAQGPWVEVLRTIGDQLTKLYPPAFEALGIDRRADRLKGDNVVYRAIREVADLFGVESFELYQARHGGMSLETTEPLAVVVGQDVVRKFNAREQKFLMGRAVLGLVNKTAIVSKLPRPELGALLGNSVRIHAPDFAALGQRDDEGSKQLRKAYSRKALKALELLTDEVRAQSRVDLEGLVVALGQAANRAGLLLCGDVAAGLSVVLKETPEPSGVRPENPEHLLRLARERLELRALLDFALSEDFFRLRQKLSLSL